MRLLPFRKDADPNESKSGELTLDQLATLRRLDVATSGESVTPRNCTRAPTVSAIVRGLSHIVGSLPVGVVETAGERRIRRPEHQVSIVAARRPNAWLTSYDFWSLVTGHLLRWGNHLSVKIRGLNNRITALHPVPWDHVGVRMDAGLDLRYSVTLENGQHRELPASDVFHVRGPSTDGLVGDCIVEDIREAIALEIAAEKYGGALFAGGGIPNVIITRPGRFKDESAFQKFKDAWQRVFRRGGTAVLEEGWKAEALQLSNEQSQFLETRKLQRAIISGAFNVPPHRIGDLERATFSNIEESGLEFVQYTLAPWISAIEKAANRDLLLGDPRFALKFSLDALLRGSTEKRAVWYRRMREVGALNANEIRALEDMDPREDEGGNEYIRPSNMVVSSSDEDPEADPVEPSDEG